MIALVLDPRKEPAMWIKFANLVQLSLTATCTSCSHSQVRRNLRPRRSAAILQILMTNSEDISEGVAKGYKAIPLHAYCFRLLLLFGLPCRITLTLDPTLSSPLRLFSLPKQTLL